MTRIIRINLPAKRDSERCLKRLKDESPMLDQKRNLDE